MDANRTITLTGGDRPLQKEGAFLFLTLRCDRPLDPGARFSLEGVGVVELVRGGRLRVERSSENGARVVGIEIPDPGISANHARLERVLGSWMIEDRKSKNGTRVDGKRIDPGARTALADGAIIEVGHTFFLFRARLPVDGPQELYGKDLKAPATGLATFSPVLAGDFDRIARVARATEHVPVVLQGETGTGKEVVARAIHELSGRPGPFVAVNCGALPQGLVEAELFGHRKGTFTSASEDRPGLVRSSDHGTLLLDEIGDLPLPAQAVLLRVLQEEEVQAVGATRPVKVDLRVVAATHRDLDKLTKEEKFRSDLLARLAGAVLHLPALRERREDLGLLVKAILEKRSFDGTKEIALTPEAARALLLHDWPRNVRELEKCLAGAVVLSEGTLIELEHLSPDVRAAFAGPAGMPPIAAGAGASHDKKYDELMAQLEAHDWNVTETARAMGKARSHIQRLLRRYGIKPLPLRRRAPPT